MLSVSNLSVQFGKRILFDDVNTNFTQGNCYGIIGANGAGKSTFLKILAGDIDPTSGHVHLEPGKRMSVLNQNHNMFDEQTVLETVMMGNKTLYAVKKEMDEIYLKPDFSDKDSDRVGELQVIFEEMNGWNADSDAATMLSNLGIGDEHHYTLMGDMDGKLKLRVLLAQALFGNPDVLIMDEPTNDLDFETISWLENFLANYDNTVIVVSHDRHFLDAVCTHISDIDFGKINQYSGTYTFWYESSQLAARQRAQQNKKAEEKKKELQEFIMRFSANVAKSKQATSRKKMLEKLKVDDIKPSSRRYPAIIFDQEREAGDQILNVKDLSASVDGEVLFKNIDLNMAKGDKIVVFSKDSRATSAFYEILNGNMTADSPGHVEYTRNMVTGASNSEVSIILIDARKGLLEQTHRHYFISSLLRLKTVVFCINKMDLVDFSEDVFLNIAAEINKMTAQFAHTPDIHVIPISSLKGDNVVNTSLHMAWYTGESLSAILHSIVPDVADTDDFRMDVQQVLHVQNATFTDYRAYAGRIISGSIAVGDTLSILPSGTASEVIEIRKFINTLQNAHKGASVQIRLKDDVDASRGMMLVKEKNDILLAKDISATLVWMDEKQAQAGGRYTIQSGTRTAVCKLQAIESIIPPENPAETHEASALKLNDIANVQLKLAAPLFLDAFDVNRGNGTFILIDPQSNNTVAVGFVKSQL